MDTRLVLTLEKARGGTKYLRKYRAAGGKWVYVYKEPDGKGRFMTPQVARRLKSLASEEDVAHSLDMIKRMYKRRPPGMGTKMPIASREDLEQILKGTKFAMISPGRNMEDPKYAHRSDEMVDTRFDQMKQFCKKAGYCFTEGRGMYFDEDTAPKDDPRRVRKDEPSIIVMIHDAQDEREMLALGAKMGQDSVLIHTPGKGSQFLYTTGEKSGKKTIPQTGYNFDANADNYYSEMPVGSEKLKFSMNVSWDMEKSFRMALSVFLKAAGSHKWIERWRGTDGQYRYKYAKPGAEKGPKIIETKDPDKKFSTPPIGNELPNNRKDVEGYYVPFGQYVVRVPQFAIHSVFEYSGLKFVVHRVPADGEWSARWKVSEATTGMYASQASLDPEEVIAELKARIDDREPGWINNIVLSKRGEMDHVPIYDKAYSEWSMRESYAGRDTDAIISRIRDKMFAATHRDYVPNPSEKFISDWVMDGGSLAELEEESDPKIGAMALSYNLSFRDAGKALYTFDRLIDDLGGGSYSDDDVFSWAVTIQGATHMATLDVHEFLMGGTMVPSGMSAREVIMYAIDNGLKLEEAYDELNEGNEGNEDWDDYRYTGKKEYENEPLSEREHRLMKFKITERHNMSGGVQSTFWVKMTDESGKDIEGVWKPKSGEADQQVRPNIPQGTCYLREACSYEIAKAFKYTDLYPPSVVHTNPYDGIGSVQEFRAGAVPSYNGRPANEHVRRIQLFDFLVYNTDRHGGNWMIEKDDLTRPIMIDHGYTLPLSEEYFTCDIGNGYSGMDLSPAEYGPIVATNLKKLCSKLLKNGLEIEAVDRFYQRASFVKDTKRTPTRMEMSENPRHRSGAAHLWRGYPTYTQATAKEKKS